MEPLEPRAVPTTLSGTAFLDTNDNGVQDTGEDGVAGVVVTASPAAGGQLTDTTDATGHYQIDGIPYGSCSDSIAAPAGYTVSSTSETTYPGFYVTDPDTDAFTLDIGLATVPPPLPVVSMAPVNVREGTSGAVVFSRTGDTTNGLTVAYTVGGNATGGTDPNAGADYDSSLLTGTVTFAPGSDTATVTISAFKDQVYDPDEGVTLTIYPTAQYQLAGGAGSDTASNTIIDQSATFLTTNSTPGNYTYDLPWDDIDPTLASQTLPLNNFVLQFGGQTITPSNATFTVAPVADFAYGDLTNIRFAVTFNAPISGYASVSVSNDVATVVDAATLQPENDPVTDAAKRPALGVNFTPYKTGGKDHDLYVSWRLSDGSSDGVTINIPGGAEPIDVRNAVMSVLKDNGFDATPTDGGRLVVKGTNKAELTKLYLSVPVEPAGWSGPTLGLRIKTDAITPQFFLNGEELTK